MEFEWLKKSCPLRSVRGRIGAQKLDHELMCMMEQIDAMHSLFQLKACHHLELGGRRPYDISAE